jgi:hypothetical protein
VVVVENGSCVSGGAVGTGTTGTGCKHKSFPPSLPALTTHSSGFSHFGHGILHLPSEPFTRHTLNRITSSL